MQNNHDTNYKIQQLAKTNAMIYLARKLIYILINTADFWLIFWKPRTTAGLSKDILSRHKASEESSPKDQCDLSISTPRWGSLGLLG